jgi:putative tricarboxylic transport membrane protein
MVLLQIVQDLPLVEATSAALVMLTDPYVLFLILAGTLIGMISGAIPGLGAMTAIAVLIPLTFHMSPLVAVMFIAAVIGGANQGGAVTTILLNIPGRAPNAASLLDGYPMTRKGEGERALGIAATASGLGAIVGLIILFVSLPILAGIALLFSPPDIFWLAIWGLTTIAVVVRGNVLAGLISGGVGLLLSLPGASPVTGAERWVFEFAPLLNGLKLVPALIGLFAIGEMINLVSRGDKITLDDGHIGGNIWRGVRDVFLHKWVFLRSAILGIIIGVIPGVGATAANFIAYFQTVQSSSDPDSFGEGDPRGLIASEASNDAKDGGSYVPTFGFGIPGSPTMVLFMGVLVLKGIQPGPLLLSQNLEIVTATIVSALLSNILASVITIGFSQHLIKVTQTDPIVLAAMVVPVTFIASYLLNGSYFDIIITLAFGLLGFAMIRIKMSRVPLLLGLVLGPIAEDNLLRSLSLGTNDLLYLVQSPISKLLVLLSILTLVITIFDINLAELRENHW